MKPNRVILAGLITAVVLFSRRTKTTEAAPPAKPGPILAPPKPPPPAFAPPIVVPLPVITPDTPLSVQTRSGSIWTVASYLAELRRLSALAMGTTTLNKAIIVELREAGALLGQATFPKVCVGTGYTRDASTGAQVPYCAEWA